MLLIFLIAYVSRGMHRIEAGETFQMHLSWIYPEVLSHLLCVLSPELRSSARVASALSCCVISPDSKECFDIQCITNGIYWKILFLINLSKSSLTFKIICMKTNTVVYYLVYGWKFSKTILFISDLLNYHSKWRGITDMGVTFML